MSSPQEQEAHFYQVAATVLTHYPITPPFDLTLLQYENNAVFKIIPFAPPTTSFTLRIAIPWGRDKAQQCSEMLWLEALKRNKPSLSIPVPLHNNDNALVTTVTHNNQTHSCVVMSWVLGDTPEPGLFSLFLIEQLGVIIAEMHVVAEGCSPPPSHTRPRWDWEQVFGQGSFLHNESVMATLNQEQRTALQSAAEYTHHMLSSGNHHTACAMGFIHADMHLDNILISHETNAIGIIDFDECGIGYYLYDLASVIDSFQRRLFTNQADSQLGREALLRGYGSIRALPVEVEKYLGVFMGLRDMVTLNFILCSRNPNVKEWGLPRIPTLIQQLQAHLNEGNKGD